MTLPTQDQATDQGLQGALLQAREGTAFFARKLNELSDAELDGDSLLPGWSRRSVVSHVAYNAAAISRLVNWAATGMETPMYPSIQVRNDEIAFGATLSTSALRELFQESAEQLDAGWDNLTAGSWHHTVRTIQGRDVPATATVWMRSRELWVHAVDLNNGADFGDLPKAALDRLLNDVTSAWNARGADAGLCIDVTDTDGTIRRIPGARARSQDGKGRVPGDDPQAGLLVISGPLAAVVQWASGRGTSGVTARASSAPGAALLPEVPAAPAWL